MRLAEFLAEESSAIPKDARHMIRPPLFLPLGLVLDRVPPLC